MQTERSNFHIITGGPGAGKTTIIAALRQRGFVCIDEAARRVIAEQVRIGGDGLHWGDRAKFLELMLSRSIADYKRVGDARGPVFFDRGIPELIGYCRLVGLPAPAHLRGAIHRFRYAKTMFVTPPWEAIYRNDAERVQSFGEAVRTCGLIVDACVAAGYETVEVPLLTVEERVTFILERIGAEASKDRARLG